MRLAHLRPLQATLLCAALTLSARTASAQTKDHFDVGEDAPSFTLRPLNADAAKAKVVSLENYVGTDKIEKKKAVLVAFTSSTCEPCKRDLTFFAALSNEYKAKDFLVLLVDIDHDDDGLKKVADLAAQANVDFPVLGDRYNIVTKRYLVNKVPVAYLIDENQKVAKVNTAYDDSAYADMHAAVRQLLGVAAADPVPPAIATFLKAQKGTTPVVTTTAAPASQPITINSKPDLPVKGKRVRGPKKPKKAVAAAAPADEPKKGPKRVGRSATP